MVAKRVQWASHLQLLAELRHIEPRIWRRLLVPAATPLTVLHGVFQFVFGWNDSHLHEFEVAGVRFAASSIEDEELAVDENAAPLGALVRQGSKFVYRYDFGDDWMLDIKVESVLDPDRKAFRFACVDGRRAGPPDDCGGAHGYEELVRTLADPSAPDHAEMKRWVGRRFDPEKFDAEKLNKKLATVSKVFDRAMKRRSAD